MTQNEVENKFKLFNYFSVIEHILTAPKLKVKIGRIKKIDQHENMDCFVIYLNNSSIIFYYYLEKDLHYEWM